MLISGLSLLLAGRVTAQTFTALYSFTGGNDGAEPHGGLILSTNTLYGTVAVHDLRSGWGTVFTISTEGKDFMTLHSFTYNDGANPYGELVLSNNTLYGTTTEGVGSGTVFALNADGTGISNLHTFTALSGPIYTNSDGVYPAAGLILSGNTLYGTAAGGGSSGKGTVFAVNTDGTGFTNLHSFTAGTGPFPGTNHDGAIPYAGLILSGSTLYGTAERGGSSGNGTVFAVNTDGTGFTNLHSFTANRAYPYSNIDGANPNSRLMLLGNTLYGTAESGGSSGHGTVFAVNLDGTGFTNLHSFSSSDGANPAAGLILSGNTLYGTAAGGGSSGKGTVFAVNTDGTGFTNLHSFTALTGPFPGTNHDGATPNAGLVLSGDTLYGTASQGGLSGYGTVFSLSFRLQLTIIPSGANVILTWPSNYAGFDFTGFALQSAPAITGTFTNILDATSPYSNPIVGAQQFYRLSK